MSDVWYLALGFAAVWVLIGAYMFHLGRKQAHLAKRLEELERLDRVGPAF